MWSVASPSTYSRISTPEECEPAIETPGTTTRANSKFSTFGKKAGRKVPQVLQALENLPVVSAPGLCGMDTEGQQESAQYGSTTALRTQRSGHKQVGNIASYGNSH